MFSFLYKYYFYTTLPQAREQMFSWTLLALFLFWKIWNIFERGEELKKKNLVIDSNIYLIWQNLRETCWDKAGHFFDLPDFLSWKATGVTARYVNYKLDFICVLPVPGCLSLYCFLNSLWLAILFLHLHVIVHTWNILNLSSASTTYAQAPLFPILLEIGVSEKDAIH